MVFLTKMLPKERPFAFFPETRIRRGKVGRSELSSPRTPTVVNLIWIWHWPWRNVAGRIARASATDSVNDEWVQVRKSRTSPVDLSGWTLRDGRCAMGLIFSTDPVIIDSDESTPAQHHVRMMPPAQ